MNSNGAQTLVSLIVSDVVDLSSWPAEIGRRERVAMARESSSPLNDARYRELIQRAMRKCIECEPFCFIKIFFADPQMHFLMQSRPLSPTKCTIIPV